MREPGERKRAGRWCARRSVLIASAASVLLLVADGRMVAAQAAASGPVMQSLAAYIGTWRAEDRVGQDGRSSYFVYALDWFDEGRTIVEMNISQRFENGEERVLWKGFKGWDPTSEVVYYYGFSPGGRAARGHLELDGDHLVTAYEGWSGNGPVVHIRDVFGPTSDDAFSAMTLLQTEAGGEWREVSADRWSRLREG